MPSVGIVFLADKALHPMTYCASNILFVLLFFSGIITLMVMVGNLCALLFTSGGILHLVCMQLSQIVPSFTSKIDYFVNCTTCR